MQKGSRLICILKKELKQNKIFLPSNKHHSVKFEKKRKTCPTSLKSPE